jgi:hypothetical protein
MVFAPTYLSALRAPLRALQTWFAPICLGIFSLCAAEWLQASPSLPPAGAPLVAVYPPWWDAGRALSAAAAGAAVAGTGALPFIVIAVPAVPDAGAELRAGGAWLVLDGAALHICGEPQTGASTHGL